MPSFLHRCPIPTCPTPKWRVKRLRQLPPQWNDLPPDVKDPIIREFRELTCTLSCLLSHSRGSDRVMFYQLLYLSKSHSSSPTPLSSARHASKQLHSYKADHILFLLSPLSQTFLFTPPVLKTPALTAFPPPSPEIPSDVTKCCSACHNRISRKLGPEVEEPVDPSRWSEEDMDALRCALREVSHFRLWSS